MLFNAWKGMKEEFNHPVKIEDGVEIEFSDHKNLVRSATISESQRVIQWRLLLEEFGPDIRHITGEANIVANAISRLPMNEEINENFIFRYICLGSLTKISSCCFYFLSTS